MTDTIVRRCVGGPKDGALIEMARTTRAIEVLACRSEWTEARPITPDTPKPAMVYEIATYLADEDADGAPILRYVVFEAAEDEEDAGARLRARLADRMRLEEI